MPKNALGGCSVHTAAGASPLGARLPRRAAAPRRELSGKLRVDRQPATSPLPRATTHVRDKLMVHDKKVGPVRKNQGCGSVRGPTAPARMAELPDGPVRGRSRRDPDPSEQRRPARRGFCARAMPPVEKKAEEMHVLGAPGTPAPAHAERNRPTPQARMPHELSPADSLVPMVTQRSDVPHLTTAHAERPRAAVCVRSICHTRNLRRAGRPEPRLGHRHPRHGQLAGWVSAGLNVFGGGLGCAGACS